MDLARTDHARVVLSGIISSGKRHLLDVASRNLTEDHFEEGVLRNIFKMLGRYADATGGILTQAALKDILLGGGQDPGKVALYVETFESLTTMAANEESFRWSIQQLRDEVAARETGEALAAGAEILRSGATGPKGELIRGHEAARHAVLERFAEIERGLSLQAAPEGDAWKEGREILEDYAERKAARVSGKSRGVLFGIPALDEVVGGLQPGELDLVVGYSSDGKTSLCVQLAWSAVVEQGLNVLFLTTETLRVQVRRKLVSRHSLLPQFGLENGLNSKLIKAGTLTETEERKLAEVVDDINHNSAYGTMYLAQVPAGSTPKHIEQRLYRAQRDFDVHLCIVDYLRLFSSGRRYTTEREELGSILVQTKQLAPTFNDGAGVPIVSPWQVNRTSREEAEKSGFYTTRSLAETSESTNSGDVILGLLAQGDPNLRHRQGNLQVMKNRDGETRDRIQINIDYGTCSFTSVARTDMDSLLGDGGTDAMGDLLH